MFISDRAIEHMEKTAQSVGFGNRNDYPFRGSSAISCGDWKGNSIAACVFADERQAQEYLAKAMPELTGLGADATCWTVPIVAPDFEAGCIAVIAAIDLCHTDDGDGTAPP